MFHWISLSTTPLFTSTPIFVWYLSCRKNYNRIFEIVKYASLIAPVHSILKRYTICLTFHSFTSTSHWAVYIHKFLNPLIFSLFRFLDKITQWSTLNKFQLDSDKCKELRVSFAKTQRQFSPIMVNGQEPEIVPKVKQLGLNISSNLTWNAHVRDVIKKGIQKNLFFNPIKESKCFAWHQKDYV